MLNQLTYRVFQPEESEWSKLFCYSRGKRTQQSLFPDIGKKGYFDLNVTKGCHAYLNGLEVSIEEW